MDKLDEIIAKTSGDVLLQLYPDKYCRAAQLVERHWPKPIRIVASECGCCPNVRAFKYTGGQAVLLDTCCPEAEGLAPDAELLFSEDRTIALDDVRPLIPTEGLVVIGTNSRSLYESMRPLSDGSHIVINPHHEREHVVKLKDTEEPATLVFFEVGADGTDIKEIDEAHLASLGECTSVSSQLLTLLCSSSIRRRATGLKIYAIGRAVKETEPAAQRSISDAILDFLRPVEFPRRRFMQLSIGPSPLSPFAEVLTSIGLLISPDNESLGICRWMEKFVREHVPEIRTTRFVIMRVNEMALGDISEPSCFVLCSSCPRKLALCTTEMPFERPRVLLPCEFMSLVDPVAYPWPISFDVFPPTIPDDIEEVDALQINGPAEGAFAETSHLGDGLVGYAGKYVHEGCKRDEE